MIGVCFIIFRLTEMGDSMVEVLEENREAYEEGKPNGMDAISAGVLLLFFFIQYSRHHAQSKYKFTHT